MNGLGYKNKFNQIFMILFLFRKRFSNSGAEIVPDGTNGLSASSRDGGDEYSSEASELDASGTVSFICSIKKQHQ